MSHEVFQYLGGKQHRKINVKILIKSQCSI